jgi:flagellar biosynthesis regulator FlbT
MSKFSDLFIYLDFFGTKPGFFINGCDTHRSIFGALISIVVCSIIFGFFCIFLNQIIKHNKPHIVHNEFIDDNPAPYVLNNNNFVFTLSLQYPNYTNFVNEKIYTIKAKKVTYVYNEAKEYKTVETDINVYKCSNFNFSLIPEYFKSLNIENLYCLDLNGVFLQGEYGKNNWQTINVYFYKCLNTTENNNTCDLEEDIEKTLMGGYIDLFITDFKVNTNDFSNPIKIYGKNLFGSISISHYSDYWLYLKRKEVISDLGLIFTDYKKETCLTFDKMTETQYITEENFNFLTLIIRISTNREEVMRTYLKLYEAAANVGGVVKIMFSIGEAINYLVKVTLYKNYLLQFFNLDIFLGKKSKKKKVASSFIRKVSENLEIENNEKILQNLQNNQRNNSKIVNTNNKINNVILQTSTELLKNNNVSTIVKNNYVSQKSAFFKPKKKIYSDNNVFKNKNNLKNKKNEEKNQEKKDIINNLGLMRIIKNYKSVSNVICSKRVYTNFKEIRIRFCKINFLLEISYYFKLININNYLKDHLLKKEEITLLNKIYHFNYHYDREKNYYSQINDYFLKFKT